ncbi:MAG: ribosome rescue protein RqcH [Candidatus Bathyarchaeia archaeon]
MKRELTSFDVAAIVTELRKLILDAWIVNIYQSNFKTVIFKLHKPDQATQHLVIEVGNRLHITHFSIAKPLKPSGFCVGLRKFLRNGKIQAIEQHEFERIVIMKIKAKQEEFAFIVELFGDGNIILVNKENKILQALTYRKMRDRNILRNENFQYPPPSGKNPFKIERKDLDEIRSFDGLETVKALARFLGMGGFYTEEILLRAHIDKNTPCNSLNNANLDTIFKILKELLSIIETEKLSPAIIINDKGRMIDAVPVLLEKYASFQSKPCPTFNDALDMFYAETAIEEEKTAETTDMEQSLAQQERILLKQQKTIEEIEKEIKNYKKIGDIIYAHFNELQSLFQKFTNAKNDGKSWKETVSNIEKEKKAGEIPAVYFSSFNFENAILCVSVDDLTFSVNLRKSIQENAAEYYEKAKKSQKRLDGAKKALQQTIQKMAEIKKRSIEKITAISKPELQQTEPRAWYEKFRWFYSSEGFLVLGGKDASTNEVLIKKYVEPNDIVFHADITGAPFVVVKTEGREASEQTIKEAAEFAAVFSRAWREMLGAVDVYWVRPDQVSKTPPSGQFLPKGSFMIYGKKNYLRKVPLQTAIGVVPKEEGKAKVIGGPKDAIAKQTNYYVEIFLGDLSSGALAKTVRTLLSQKVPKELRETVLLLPLEEIQKFIPPGKGKVSQ